MVMMPARLPVVEQRRPLSLLLPKLARRRPLLLLQVAERMMLCQRTLAVIMKILIVMPRAWSMRTTQALSMRTPPVPSVRTKRARF